MRLLSLNFRYAAEYVIKVISESRVVTFGCDDTKKLAGNQFFDVKPAQQFTRKTLLKSKRTKKLFLLVIQRIYLTQGQTPCFKLHEKM